MAAPDETRAQSPTRRTFFAWLSNLAGAMAALCVGVPLIGFLFGVRQPTVPWVTLGPVSKFPLGQTLLEVFANPLAQSWDGVVAKTGVYVRHLGTDQNAEPRFLVLAVNCAHLGCPVTWFPQSGLFMCPCHGGVYYENGERASGPPPRGMFHCVWRVHDGNLQVRAPHYPTLQNTLQDET